MENAIRGASTQYALRSILNYSGLSLEQVPRVPGTRKILSSYLMAPVNFSEISSEHLPGTRGILRPLIRGTRGLKFLKTAL